MARKKYKIGIVCPYDYFRAGGVQEHVRAVAQELRKRGHTVKILAPTPPNGDTPRAKDVITLGVSTKISASATSFEISASASPSEIDQVLEKEGFDLIHYHEPMIPLLAGQILSRSNAINVATFHAHKSNDLRNMPLDLIHLPYHRNKAKYINAITTVSEASAVYLSKASDEDLEIVPNGIELAKYNPSKTGYYKEFHDDVKTILYVGRLEKRKGVEYLLRAYEEFREEYENCRLVIAGDGGRRRALQSYIEQYDVPDVHLLGYVSDADKKKLLKTADLYCSPALYGESFGIVLVEAMAMGVPIIAGANPGYESVMRETGVVSLVNPKNQDEFVRHLHFMLLDEGIRKVFVKWEREYVKQFDYKKVTDAYVAIYNRLIREAQA